MPAFVCQFECVNKSKLGAGQNKGEASDASYDFPSAPVVAMIFALTPSPETEKYQDIGLYLEGNVEIVGDVVHAEGHPSNSP